MCEASPGPARFIRHNDTFSDHPIGAGAALVCLEQMQTQNVGQTRPIAALEPVSASDAKPPMGNETMTCALETAYVEGVMNRFAGRNFVLSPPLIVSKPFSPSGQINPSSYLVVFTHLTCPKLFQELPHWRVVRLTQKADPPDRAGAHVIQRG